MGEVKNALSPKHPEQQYLKHPDIYNLSDLPKRYTSFGMNLHVIIPFFNFRINLASCLRYITDITQEGILNLHN